MAMDRVHPVRVNWQLIIADLELAGITLYKAAQLMGVEWSTAQRWGGLKQDIGFGYGRALLALHVEYCGERTTLQRLEMAEKAE